MPKKFAGENSKAAVAKARKDAVKKEQQLKKQQAAEDELWRDDDKHVLRKQQRKVFVKWCRKYLILFPNSTILNPNQRRIFVQDDKEKKKQEQLEKKQASKILLETEMSSIKSSKPEPAKLTRTQIAVSIQRWR